MKKKTLFKIFLIISILYMPIMVDAASCPTTTLDIDVCQSGCQFDNINDAIDYLDDYGCQYYTSIAMNIGPGTYTINSHNINHYQGVSIRGAGKDKTIINYLGNHGFDFLYPQNIQLSDFTIKNSKGSDAFGAIILTYSYGSAVIRNINIESYSKYGIFVQSIVEGTTISNVNIKNASDAAIYRNECFHGIPCSGDPNDNAYNESAISNGIVNIINSDLTGNGCGIVEGGDYCSSQSPINNASNTPAEKFEAIEGVVPAKNYKYTTGLRNTKLSCAAASSDRDSKYTPLIYIPKNNTWIEEPEYFENIVEHNDGQVQVELEDDRTLGLNNKSGISIKDVFKNIDSFGEKEIEIEDESIIKIEGDKIIPLKIGETSTTIKSGNATYILNLRVVENIANPKTSNTTYILILLLGLVAVSTLTKIIKRI